MSNDPLLEMKTYLSSSPNCAVQLGVIKTNYQNQTLSLKELSLFEDMYTNPQNLETLGHFFFKLYFLVFLQMFGIMDRVQDFDANLEYLKTYSEIFVLKMLLWRFLFWCILAFSGMTALEE